LTKERASQAKSLSHQPSERRKRRRNVQWQLGKYTTALTTTSPLEHETNDFNVKDRHIVDRSLSSLLKLFTNTSRRAIIGRKQLTNRIRLNHLLKVVKIVHHFFRRSAKMMIEVICNDRLGKKVRIKCNHDDTIGDLKKLIAAQTGTKAEKIVLKKWCKSHDLD
jgi:hypothetical protein